MSTFVRKSHNVSALLYHAVCPSKYRRAVFDPAVDEALRDICLEIAARYEITFLEIGTDRDHVHFLVQSVPTYSPTQVARIVKSITAKEVFRRVPAVKRQLWGGALCSSGFYIDTVGRHGSEETICLYVREQGAEKDYTRLHWQQMELF